MILGDFNLEPEDAAWDAAREAGWVPLLEEDDGLKSMVGDTHLYDNIWANGAYTANSGWLGASGVIKFDEVLSFGTREEAIKELSDHRPTWAFFASDVEDDEGDASRIFEEL